VHSVTSLSTSPGTRRSPDLLRARAGVSLVFLANGLGFANLVPRFPEIVEEAATDVLLVGRDTRMLSVDDGVRAIEEGLR